MRFDNLAFYQGMHYTALVVHAMGDIDAIETQYANGSVSRDV